MADYGSHLGTGAKFPFEIDKATGRFKTVSGEQSVKESIYIILMTQLTERLMRPDFGTDIMGYAFMDVSLTRINMMRRSLTNMISRQEPRISDIEITINMADSQDYLIINIDYLVAESNTRDNMVFPFYLNISEEEENEEEYYEPEIEEEIDG
jgi:phage baseplate assembly protein W